MCFNRRAPPENWAELATIILNSYQPSHWSQMHKHNGERMSYCEQLLANNPKILNNRHVKGSQIKLTSPWII
jgi:hypothetical protein